MKKEQKKRRVLARVVSEEALKVAGSQAGGYWTSVIVCSNEGYDITNVAGDDDGWVE